MLLMIAIGKRGKETGNSVVVDDTAIVDVVVGWNGRELDAWAETC
jgi:hypothetical protein